MHRGKRNLKSKTKAMFFPSSLSAAMNQMELLQTFTLNNDENCIHFTDRFKYLSAIIMPCLMEDAEIKAQIKQAKSQMGILKHFFNCKDVTQQVKYWIYITGPLNTLLWGSKSLNISEHNHDKLQAFPHSSI